MPVQYSVEVRNAMLDAIESTTGTAAKLRIYTGSPPANTAAAATGTLLVDMTLPSDWMSAASAGTKALLGTWQATASGTGTAGYYRVWNNGVTRCDEQGTVTLTAGGGDITLDNTSINNGQSVTITSKTITAPNA
jgi:hypothetical protein